MQFIFQFTNLHLQISTETQQYHWEGLITKQRTPKQSALGMILHRIPLMNSFCFNLLYALLCP